MRDRGHNFTGKSMPLDVDDAECLWPVEVIEVRRMAMSNNWIETLRDHRRTWTREAADIKADDVYLLVGNWGQTADERRGASASRLAARPPSRTSRSAAAA